MRKRQGIRALAAAAVALALLAGCASEPRSSARPPQTQQQDDTSLANRQPIERQQQEPDAPNPEPKLEGPAPDHMGMPPQYDVLPIWPASGMISFPHELDDGFTGGTDINDYDSFVSSLYTDDDYNLVSVRVADNFYSYNGRDSLYSDMRYIDGVLCGSTVGVSSSEINSRICWMVGTDGVVWMSSYSADISYQDLAGYTKTVYASLVESAAEGQ